jgi:hypothetical protein
MLPIRARREKVTACLPRHLGDDVASLGEATDYLRYDRHDRDCPADHQPVDAQQHVGAHHLPKA